MSLSKGISAQPKVVSNGGTAAPRKVTNTASSTNNTGNNNTANQEAGVNTAEQESKAVSILAQLNITERNTQKREADEELAASRTKAQKDKQDIQNLSIRVQGSNATAQQMASAIQVVFGVLGGFVSKLASSKAWGDQGARGA